VLLQTTVRLVQVVATAQVAQAFLVKEITAETG
jgi:hypothetical protein